MSGANACYNCPRRSAEPNCHNVETCPDWAKEEAKKAERYRRTQERNAIAARMAKYDKSHGRYVMGVNPYSNGGPRPR